MAPVLVQLQLSSDGVMILLSRRLTNYLSMTETQGLDTHRPDQIPSEAVQKGRPASDEAKHTLCSMLSRWAQRERRWRTFSTAC